MRHWLDILELGQCLNRLELSGNGVCIIELEITVCIIDGKAAILTLDGVCIGIRHLNKVRRHSANGIAPGHLLNESRLFRRLHKSNAAHLGSLTYYHKVAIPFFLAVLELNNVNRAVPACLVKRILHNTLQTKSLRLGLHLID